MFNKTVDKAVGTGTRAKLAKAAADNAIWMPVTTCLLFAALKLAQGQPEEIASGLQVSLVPPPCRLAALMPLTVTACKYSTRYSKQLSPCIIISRLAYSQPASKHLGIEMPLKL